MAIIKNLKIQNLTNNFFVSTSNFFQPVFDCYFIKYFLMKEMVKEFLI